VQKLVEKRIPVISEIEFAAPLQSGNHGITGSNGKTTTTMLILSFNQSGGLNIEDWE
jgi:UDP-N-acetylmuramoylalanine--D-glutamate ligase